MSDLISREAALAILKFKPIDDGGVVDDCIMQVLALAKSKVNKLPAVDAVEAVRCKDCIHGIKDDFDNLWQCIRTAEYDEETDMYFGFSSFHVEDFYCADGERREENENHT